MSWERLPVRPFFTALLRLAFIDCHATTCRFFQASFDGLEGRPRTFKQRAKKVEPKKCYCAIGNTTTTKEGG